MLTPHRTAGLMFLGIVIGFLYFLPNIVADVIAIAFIAYLVTPLIRSLETGYRIRGKMVLRVPRGISIPIITLVVPLLIMAGFGTYLVAVAMKLESVFSNLPIFSKETLRPWLLEWVTYFQSTLDDTPFARMDFTPYVDTVATLPAAIGRYMVENLMHIAKIVPHVVHWAIFLIMLWIGTSEWENKVAPVTSSFVRLMAPDNWAHGIARIFADIDQQLRSLLYGWMKIGLILACVLLLVFIIAGFPVMIAVFLALVAGVLSVVPFVGSWLALLVSLVVTLAQFMASSWYPYFVVIIGVGFVNFVLESKFLTPKYIGDSLRVWKIAVILMVVIGGQMFGVIGFVAALPLLAIFKSFLMEGITQLVYYKIQNGEKEGVRPFLPMIRRYKKSLSDLKLKEAEARAQARAHAAALKEKEKTDAAA